MVASEFEAGSKTCGSPGIVGALEMYEAETMDCEVIREICRESGRVALDRLLVPLDAGAGSVGDLGKAVLHADGLLE